VDFKETIEVARKDEVLDLECPLLVPEWMRDIRREDGLDPFALHSQNPSEHPPRIEVEEVAELSEWDGLDRPEFAQAHRGSVPIVIETERAFQDSRGEPKKVHNHERHPPSSIDERKHVASRSFGVTEDDVAVDEAALSNSLLRPRRLPPRRTNEACLLGSGERVDAGPSRLSPASASPRGSSRSRRAGRRPLARRVQAPRSCGSGALRRLRRAPESTGGFRDRKSTRLNSSHVAISYAVFCLKKKNNLCNAFWRTEELYLWFSV